MYFIKNVAVTDRQAREHLAQIQRKSQEEKRNKNDKHGDQKLATRHEPKRLHHET
jgi:hypothetical protein